MSSGFFGAASGANVNLNNSYEFLGWTLSSGNPDGTLTGVAGGTTANTFPVTGTSIGTTANAWAGFFLYLGPASTNRYILDISFDGGTTWAIQGLYVEPASSGMQAPMRVPVAVPAGAVIVARLKASASTQTLHVGFVGIIKNASSPPCFSTMTGLNIDGTATHAATADTPLSSPATNTWTSQVASTAAAYGALFMMPGGGTSTPITAQAAALSLGVDPTGGTTYAEVARYDLWIAPASQPTLHAMGYIIEHAVPAGSRLATRILAVTPGSDAMRVGLYGLA